MTLENDPRWRRLEAQGMKCSSCEQIHFGVFDLGLKCPDYWRDSDDISSNSTVEKSQNFCSEDFCILDGEHFFVRCTLELPILGAGDQTFAYGIWSSLAEANFRLYVEHSDGHDGQPLPPMGPWFGWFSNRLKGYPDTTGLECRIHPEGGGRRPRVELEQHGHPLSIEQSEGVSFDRLLEIYALYGHDLDDARTD